MQELPETVGDEMTDLPYVAPLKSNHHCRLCRRWLEGDWVEATTEEARAEIQRQMDAGRCDDCTRRVFSEIGPFGKCASPGCEAPANIVLAGQRKVCDRHDPSNTPR